MTGRITRQELSPALRNELDSVRDYIAGSNNAEMGAHMSSQVNPHGVTKAQVGLGNVLNVKQASDADFLAHKGDKANPHSVTTAQIGAVPTSRAVHTTIGLIGGGALTQNRTLEINWTEFNKRYLPKSGGVVNGHVTAKSFRAGGGTGEYIFTNAVDTNGIGTHIYIRPEYGSEVRITKTLTTNQYESIRAKSYLSQYGQPAYHKKESIKWGTGNPSGGSDGDIYIQY